MRGVEELKRFQKLGRVVYSNISERLITSVERRSNPDGRVIHSIDLPFIVTHYITHRPLHIDWLILKLKTFLRPSEKFNLISEPELS